jgi:hypothetical protein
MTTNAPTTLSEPVSMKATLAPSALATRSV